MHSGIRETSAESTFNLYLSNLTVDDIPFLKPLELQVRLAFWGDENYRKFLEEFPAYFGCKAVRLTEEGGEKLVGFYLARSVYDDLEILKIAVSPSCQRQGIGTQLMQTAFAEGIRRGCSKCFLEVRKSNQQAIQFYYVHNFRISGTRINYYTYPVEDAWIMERVL